MPIVFQVPACSFDFYAPLYCFFKILRWRFNCDFSRRRFARFYWPRKLKLNLIVYYMNDFVVIRHRP